MNTKHDSDERVEALLAEGLELYGRGMEPEAAKKWREVLRLRPGEPRALDYLESSGVSESPGAEVVSLDQHRERRSGKTLTDTDEHVLDSPVLLALVRDKRLEEALMMLYEARSRSPEDASISRSIQHLKNRLVRQYAQQLGSLDASPTQVKDKAALIADSEAKEVLRLADGIFTFDDILSSCALGRFRTFKVLVQLVQSGVLSAPRPSVVAELEDTRPLPKVEESTAASVPPQVTVPQASISPSRPSTPPPASATFDPFEDCFREATKAYVCRDYSRARELYERCLVLRPGDARVSANLARLPKS